MVRPSIRRRRSTLTRPPVSRTSSTIASLQTLSASEPVEEVTVFQVVGDLVKTPMGRDALQWSDNCMTLTLMGELSEELNRAVAE